MDKKIIILTGPTGVGKTEYSIDLAKKINGEIISGDSFQIYKGMNIGTAKITPEKMKGVVHHNLDLVKPDEEFNVAMFKNHTLEIIDNILERGKVPILVGGTGLYLHSIIYDLEFSNKKTNKELREQIEERVKTDGLKSIYNEMAAIDSKIETVLDKDNRHRVIRAYEVYKSTGQLPSETLGQFREPNNRFDPLYLVLNEDRQKLYDNINKRVLKMIDLGLEEEIDDLLEKGYNFDLRSFKAIGYKEFENYYKGDWNLDQVIEKIQQHTRNFAKRQLTWFRREEDALWINKDDYTDGEELSKTIIKLSKEYLDS